MNKFSVSNSAEELITILSDLVSTLSSEVHIDSAKGNTYVSPGTVNALNDIKKRIDSFK